MKILKGVCVWWGGGGGKGEGWAGPLTYPSSICGFIFIREFFKLGAGGIVIVYEVDMNSLRSHLL